MSDFLETKYTRWYWQIIAKRAIKDKDARGEVHHIIPRSLGGSDEPQNLVKLSGHDHAWCHWLLTKMTTGHHRALMIYAFNMMGVYGDHMERKKSYAIVRAYERNREEWSRVHSENMTGREPWNKGLKEDRPEVLARLKEACAAREIDPQRQADGQAKRLEKMKGYTHSSETKEKQRMSQLGKKKGVMSEDHKKALSDALTGHKKVEGHGAKVAAANRGVVSINKDGVEKKIKRDDLQSWIDQGWQKGGKSRSPYKIST